MNNICYFIQIQTRICQSGVPLYSKKIYTNITSSDTINIYSGYTLNISSDANDTLTLLINNIPFNLSLTFNISNGESILLDLPLDNGTIKILICAAARCCAET